VTLGCAGNTDAAACEVRCNDNADPTCQDEYEAVKECESTLMASGFQCFTPPGAPFSFIVLSGEGSSACETEVMALDSCID